MELKRDNPCCHCGKNVRTPDDEWQSMLDIAASLPEDYTFGGMSAICDECYDKGLEPTDPTDSTGRLMQAKKVIDMRDGDYSKGAERLLKAIFDSEKSPPTKASEDAKMAKLEGIRMDVSIGAYICPFCTAVHLKVDDRSEPEKCNAFAVRDEEWDELFKIVNTLRRERDKQDNKPRKDH